MQSYIKLCELIMASITWGLAAQPLDSLPRFGEISDHVIPPVQLRPPSTVEARNCESFYTPSLSVWMHMAWASQRPTQIWSWKPVTTE